jgi:hypothetical protein
MKTRQSVLLLLLVTLATSAFCAPFFRALYGMGDEGLFLRGAELMLQGKILYADFFEFLPPVSFALTAAWFSVAGVSIEAARTLALLTIVGIACFTFLACLRASEKPLFSALLTCGWVMMTQWHWLQINHHWFTTLFSMIAAWAALVSLEQAQKRSLRWPLIAGLAAGAATMVTPTRGACAALAAVTTFFDLRQKRTEFLAYVLGGLLLFSGVIAMLAGQHTLVAAFNDVVGFAMTRYASIQHVSYAHDASVFDWPLKYAFPIAALLLLLVVARDWRRRAHDHRLRLCAAFALAGFLGLYPRPDMAHIGFTVPLALPLIAACGSQLSLPLRKSYRLAIILSVTIGIATPTTLAFLSIAKSALGSQIVTTPRGNVTFPFNENLSELIRAMAATPAGEGFIFYPYMPMLPFLVARRHVSEYDLLIPWYTTPAQYRDACLSAVRHASWLVLDRRFETYSHWQEDFPAMPEAQPLEAVRFERALDDAFEASSTSGFFDLRRRRDGVNDSICAGIAGPASNSISSAQTSQ